MRSFLKSLTLANVKDYVSIGAGLAAILGGLITGGALFFSGGGASPEPTPVPSIVLAGATSASGQLPSPTLEPTPNPTDTPTPSGEFLRVQFGNQQDPRTLLPAGETVSPDDDIEVCAGDYLFAWVYHSFEPGTVIDARFSDRAGVLFSPSITVERDRLYVWVSVRIAETGEHTLAVSQQDGTQRAEWSVNVTCNRN